MRSWLWVVRKAARWGGRGKGCAVLWRGIQIEERGGVVLLWVLCTANRWSFCAFPGSAGVFFTVVTQVLLDLLSLQESGPLWSLWPATHDL